MQESASASESKESVHVHAVGEGKLQHAVIRGFGHVQHANNNAPSTNKAIPIPQSAHMHKHQYTKVENARVPYSNKQTNTKNESTFPRCHDMYLGRALISY